MLIPREVKEAAFEAARKAADGMATGDPLAEETELGPLASRAQFEKVQSLIQRGVDEGATLLAGGLGRPSGLTQGWFVRPTVFGDVSNDMTIAREEIFGPVLSLIAYDSVEEAIDIANDSLYGLAAFVQGPAEEARSVARRLRAGQVTLNEPADEDMFAPFGGYKQSGNGREFGPWGIQEYCEIKAILGFED